MLRSPIPTALGTNKLIVTTTPVENVRASLLGLDVLSTYGSTVFIQVHSGKALPSNGAVPIMTPIRVPTNTQIQHRFDVPIQVAKPGIVIAASSTEGTLTIDGSATVDISALVEDWEPITHIEPGDTVVGDLTTAVASRTIWNEASGPKLLRRLQIKNLVSAVRYAVIYAVNSPAASSKIVAWQKLTADQNVDLYFGRGGLSPLQLDGDGTLHQACVVAAQANLVPGNVSGSNDFNVQGRHA